MGLRSQQGVRTQRGLGLIGLLIVLALAGAVVLIGLKVFPTVNEYLTIQRAVDRIASSDLATVQEVRTAFESTKAVEYSIVSIDAKDLEITKQGDKIVINYAYSVEIELVPPVYLLMKYQGRSK